VTASVTRNSKEKENEAHRLSGRRFENDSIDLLKPELADNWKQYESKMAGHPV
jgi:hypothetical protein